VSVHELEELEEDSDLPYGDKLEFRDGFLFWPATREGVVVQKRFGVVVEGSDTVQAVYVPLLGKAAFDRWRTLFAQGGVDSLPYRECRVVAKISLNDLDTRFPAIAAAVRDRKRRKPLDHLDDTRQSFTGSAHLVITEEKHILEGLGRGDLSFDATRTLVLTVDSLTDNSKINHIIALCLCVFAVLSWVPLGVWIVRRWRKPKKEN
jgi:hypothetical protein